MARMIQEPDMPGNLENNGVADARALLKELEAAGRGVNDDFSAKIIAENNVADFESSIGHGSSISDAFRAAAEESHGSVPRKPVSYEPSPNHKDYSIGTMPVPELLIPQEHEVFDRAMAEDISFESNPSDGDIKESTKESGIDVNTDTRFMSPEQKMQYERVSRIESAVKFREEPANLEDDSMMF